MSKISSGSDTVDRFIGGYPDCVLTMIYGEPGSGKTTLGMHAALIQAKYGRKVIYIDVEHSFSLDRLRQLDPSCDNYLSNIFLLRPSSLLEQERQILALPSNVSLVVVDTIGHYYRLCWKDNSEETNASLLRQLRALAELTHHQIPVLLLNQVYTNIDTGELRNVGGNLIRKWCKFIICLTKNPSVFHHEEPDGKKCSFSIVSEGIRLLL